MNKEGYNKDKNKDYKKNMRDDKREWITRRKTKAEKVTKKVKQ